MAAFERTSARAWYATAAIVLITSTSAVAQQGGDPAPSAQPSSTSALKLPENPQLFGTAMPSVIKATAIVNGDVITQTDVDQRLALLAIANGGKIPADEAERLRQQVLRNLIDETLQIQSAKSEKITIKSADIDKTVARVASGVKQTPEQLAAYLEANGSSIKSLRRQIEGEIAWQRLQRAKIESSVTVGDDEVKAVLDKLNASKGTEEYHIGEIFLPAPAGSEQQVTAQANQILEQLKAGASFAGYARQYSQSSSAAVGGDLGWMRPEQLPDPIATVLRTMTPGMVSTPIPNSGAFPSSRSRTRARSSPPIRATQSSASSRCRSTSPRGPAARQPSRSWRASRKPRRRSAAAAVRTRWQPISMARSCSRTR